MRTRLLMRNESAREINEGIEKSAIVADCPRNLNEIGSLMAWHVINLVSQNMFRQTTSHQLEKFERDDSC